MITSVKIMDNKRSPVRYLPEVKAFRNGSEFVFKPGVNVVIGPNGCGKSTLIRLLQIYTFCHHEMESTMRKCNLLAEIQGSFDRLTPTLGDGFFGGVDVVADYSVKTFNLCGKEDYFGNDSFSRSRVMARFDCSGKSAGEERLYLFDIMCGKMFEGGIGMRIDYGYCPDGSRKEAQAYYSRNHRGGDVMPTILMDEPDQNLDVVNGRMLFDILGKKQRPDTQVIASLHNPALIYKLSRLDCVNFIEMGRDYLKKVVRFVNG